MENSDARPPFASLAEWLSWQESLHPKEIELGLDRVNQVYQALQLHFPSSYRVVSVAGSNGKGSCVAYLSAMLQALGYRVGQYTSPHLLRYNERIRVNGDCISDDELMRAFNQVEQARHGVSLTYFEFGTLAALSHFASSACDILILEVGLGGRLDAVNIVDADIAVITSIGLDHMDWLGDTREQIAAEKAGILRKDRAFVCSELEPPANLRQIAAQVGARSYWLGTDFFLEQQGDSRAWRSDRASLSDLPRAAMNGEFQWRNIAAALMCVSLLDEQAMRRADALRGAIAHMRLAGRIQIIRQQPLCLVDVSHNQQAVTELANYLAAIKQQRQHQGKPVHITAVFSILARKDVNGVIAAIAPVIDTWMLAPMQQQASQDSDSVASLIRQHSREHGFNVTCECFQNLASAWRHALTQASDNDIVIAFGSFYTVAEILNL